MHSDVSSGWLPSYNKATRTVLEIFKMDGYFPDSLCVGVGVGVCVCVWVCVCVYIYIYIYIYGPGVT